MGKGHNNQNDDSGHSVGYGKPPVKTRFQPGRSGNPRGRPRGSKNRPRPIDLEPLKSILTEEAYRPIKMREGDRITSMPVARAIVRTMSASALKGNTRSQKDFLGALSTKEKEDAQQRYSSIEAAIEYKRDYQEELDRRKKLGTTGPEPIPHPYHVVINFAAGSVLINGPRTKEEKQAWDSLKNKLRGVYLQIERLEKSLSRKPDDQFTFDKLDRLDRLYERLLDLVPPDQENYFFDDT